MGSRRVGCDFLKPPWWKISGPAKQPVEQEPSRLGVGESAMRAVSLYPQDTCEFDEAISVNRRKENSGQLEGIQALIVDQEGVPAEEREIEPYAVAHDWARADEPRETHRDGVQSGRVCHVLIPDAG
jgi:hypothetical protein